MEEIDCAENGPYLVKNVKTFKNSKDEPIETKETMALCRCGTSNDKPFCDGTHSSINFSGENLNKEEATTDNYEGKEITIHDNRKICAHAAICTDKLNSVFKYGQEPWIDPDGAKTEETINTIKECPSGALSYTINDGEHKDQQRSPSIKICKNGPYAVEGNIKINSRQDKGASKKRYTLCRCGASKNKPFCDGAHWKVKFEDNEN
jgi:CDGSH-type Zn-finger protein